MHIIVPIIAISITAFVTLAVIVWIVFWKGYALWLAAKHGNRIWFLVMLVLNTCSLLDLYYIFFIEKKTWVDIKEVFKKPLVNASKA
jgi:hypothetical protein